MIDDYTPLVDRVPGSDTPLQAFARARLVSAVHIDLVRIKDQ
jgi:hypothetical protein